MSNQFDRIIMCPICLEQMSTPILQCKTGHSMCGDCIIANSVVDCPQCRGPLTKTRNYQLEQMIENIPKNMKVPCAFADKGCKYLVSLSDKENHEVECKNRKFLCEGRKFSKWKCEWFGNFNEMENHFKNAHPNHVMEYKGQQSIKVNLTKDLKDVHIISFFNGAQYFWFKYMVDTTKQKVFWTFQYIGTQKQAASYYYEFEISLGPIKKFKITEICDNDVTKAEHLFKNDKGVALSFAAVQNYLDDKGILSFKYRLMQIKKHNDVSK